MAMRRSLLSLFSLKNSSSTSLICESKINANVSLYFSTSVKKEQPFTVNKPQNSDSLLSYLKKNGFSITQLEKIIKIRPECLTADLEKIIKPKITLFQDLGFSDSDIADIITKNPAILHTSIKNRIIPTLSVLKRILGSIEKVAKVLRKNSWSFSRDLEETLVPNIEFFKSCGMPMEQIITKICLWPRFFLSKPEDVRKYADKAEELGFERSSKMFFYAVNMVGPMSNEIRELKFKAFRDLGFSEVDTLRVFSSAPMLFTVSKEKIRKVKEVLVETEKYDVSCILKYPTSLTYSVETRYKPRLQVLKILEEKNLIEKWPSLATLAQMPNKKFCEKFVYPFSNELRDAKLMILSKSR